MILHSYRELDSYFGNKVLLVCDNSIEYLKVNEYFNQKGNIVRFSDFVPNPSYESVVKGVNIFNAEKCDTIVAVGGGSAIDVAKCIKLYSNMSADKNFLEQEIHPNDVPLIVVPTTAGTGSEATKYAVIYYNGEKQSISDNGCIPSVVLFDNTVLDTLPLYQKKATLMDALCHALESYWSINSTDESREYSKQALRLIIRNYKEYIGGNNNKNEIMLLASNIAGKAINIAQTTAGHAMSYKITGLYNISHGHAVCLCVSKLWKFMVSNLDRCVDIRGSKYLNDTFMEIATEMGCKSIKDAMLKFDGILQELELESPRNVKEEDYSILSNSVNQIRLKNNPVELTAYDIDKLYREILGDN